MADRKRRTARRRGVDKHRRTAPACGGGDLSGADASLDAGSGHSYRELSLTPVAEANQQDSSLANVVVSPHFADRLGREAFSLPEGLTISQIISTLAQANSVPEHVRDYLVVQLDDGKIVAKSDWDEFVPPAGRTVMIYVTPAGGGSAKQVLALVLIVAISIFAPYVGAAIAGAAGVTSSLGVAAITAGVQMAGILAVSALFRPAAVDNAGGLNGPDNYALNNQSNQITPYGTIPRNYGRNRIAPRLVGQARTIFRANVQYFQAIYSFGYGPNLVEDIKSGNTPITSIPGVLYQIYEDFEAGDSLFLYTNDTSVSVVGTVLAYNTPVTSACAADTESAYIDLTWPGGLVDVNPKDGSYRYYTQRIAIACRDPAGAPPYNGFQDILTIDANYGVDGGQYWIAIARGAGFVDWTSNVTRTLLGTVRVRFPYPAAWEVRLTRQSVEQPSNITQAVTWTTLQSHKSNPPIAPRKPETIIEIEIPASEQVNNTLQLLTAVCTSKLRAWNGSSFSAPAVTRSPAWIYLDMLTGTANPRPLSDSRCDLDWFLSFANYCNRAAPNSGEPYAYCDVVIERQTTVWDAIQIPLGCARAAYAKIGGKHAGIVEETSPVPVQVFTELNCTDISVNRTYLDEPHALRVKFIDPDSDWQQRETIVYADGYNAGNATRFEDLTLPGITRQTQAWRDGRYYWACAHFRRESVQLTLDIENLACDRGSLVYMAHDVLQAGGAPGYVTEVIDSDSLRLANVDFTGINPAGLSVRVRQPTTVGPIINIASFTGTDIVNLVSAHGAQVGDLVVWGTTTTITGSYLVTDIAAQNDLKATLTLIEHQPSVLTADSGTVPPYTPQVGGRPTAEAVQPPRELDAYVSRIYLAGVPYASILLVWKPPTTPGIVRYDVLELRDTVYRGIGSTQGLQFEVEPMLLSALDVQVTRTFRVKAIAANGDSNFEGVAVAVDPIALGVPSPNKLRNADWTEDVGYSSPNGETWPDARALRHWTASQADIPILVGRNYARGLQWNKGLGGAWSVAAPNATGFISLSQIAPVQAGILHEAQVRVSIHRAKARLGLTYLDSGLNFLSTQFVEVDAGSGTLGSISDLNQDEFLWLQDQAPANTAWAELYLMMIMNGVQAGNAYAFWHRAGLFHSSADRTIANPTPWTDSSYKSGRSANVATLVVADAFGVGRMGAFFDWYSAYADCGNIAFTPSAPSKATLTASGSLRWVVTDNAGKTNGNTSFTGGELMIYSPTHDDPNGGPTSPKQTIHTEAPGEGAISCTVSRTVNLNAGQAYTFYLYAKKANQNPTTRTMYLDQGRMSLDIEPL